MIIAIFDFLLGWSNKDASKGPKEPLVSPETPDEPRPKIRCSFCGKDRDQIRKLIAGPTVYICDECIDLCNDIIYEEIDREKDPEPTASQQAQESSRQVPCSCCGELQKELELTDPLEKARFCDSCADSMGEFTRRRSAMRRYLRETKGILPCSICREPYDEAELYEPIEEPLYCEYCLAELKRLAEERKND